MTREIGGKAFAAKKIMVLLRRKSNAQRCGLQKCKSYTRANEGEWAYTVRGSMYRETILTACEIGLLRSY